MAKKKKDKEPLRMNLLAMNRKSKYCMEPIIPEDGHVFVSSDLCLHPETEYLTDRGWVPVLELQDTDLVWQVEKDSLVGSFVKPSRIIKRQYEGDMITYKSVRGGLTVTKDHNMFAVGQMSCERKRHLRYQWLAGTEIPGSGANWCLYSYSEKQGLTNFSVEDIWRVCALQADGYNEYDDVYYIQVTKDRKKERLSDLFGEKHYTSIRDGKEYYTFRRHFAHPLLSGKTINIDLLPSEQIPTFLDALSFWDGRWEGTFKGKSNHGRVQWLSTDEPLVDKIQAYLVRNGYECRKSEWAQNRAKGDKPLWALSIKKEGTIRCFSNGSGSLKTKEKRFTEEVVEQYKGMVGCVTVPTGLIMVRSRGQVFCVNNCSGEPTVLLNLSEDPTLYSVLYGMRGKRPYWEKGLLLSDSLYVTTMSQTPLLKSLLDSLGEDWLDLWITDNDQAKKQLGSKYAICKMIVLALIYGLGIASLGRHLFEADVVMTKEEITAIYNGFWDSLPQAKLLRDYLSLEFKKAKKKHQCYVSPLGFPLPSGDPHKGLNYCVQSGVSSWIRKLNLDLFSNEKFRLIAIIHDELVTEVAEKDLEEYQTELYRAEAACNEFFGFKYPLKLGFNVARNFYEFKG